MNTNNTQLAPAPGFALEPVQRLALPSKEAAAALGIGTRLLWEKTQTGEIPSVKIGARVVYPVSALEKWLNEQSAGRCDK
jgi:excisionase family DNA binding protein